MPNDWSVNPVRKVVSRWLLVLLFLAPFPLSAASPVTEGVFLRATEGMSDPRFERSVVLIVRHDSGGTLGVIVNHPLQTTLDRLFPVLPEVLPAALPLYYGGPVSPELVTVLFAGGSSSASSHEILPGVRFGRLDRLLEDPGFLPDPDRMRVLSGVASWAPGQLAHEVVRGGWQLLPATPADIFAPDPNRLWQRLQPGRMILIQEEEVSYPTLVMRGRFC